MTDSLARDPAPATRRALRIALAGLFAAAFVAFLALGTWQVERRAWKLALIDRVGQRVDAPAVPAPGPDRWAEIRRDTDEYRHVRVSGRFLRGTETFVQAVTRLGAGFWMLAPLRTPDGSIVLVNRGFVAEPSRRNARATEGPSTTVTGLMRLTEPGGGFLRKNDPAADRWYSRDVAAMARARGLDRVAPYFVDADAAPESVPDEPVGGLTVVQFSNHHLVYAITWYALALLSAAGGWQLVRDGRGSRAQAAGGSPPR